MQTVFRKKISSASNIEKIQLNVGYDYFSKQERREAYDAKDITKLQYVEFDYNLIILKNDKEFLEKILQVKNKLDFDINKKGIFDMTFLYMACRGGYKDLVAILLENSSNPSQIQGTGSSGLHASAFYGHMNIIKLLLEVGVDADIINYYGCLAEDEALTEEIKKFINNFKLIDKSYQFFKENNYHFKEVKLVFNKNEYVGKRALIKYESENLRKKWMWNLAWHGTRLEFIPSIIKNGIKKVGEKVEGKIVSLREDTSRIQRNREFRCVKDWASAVFTSQSLFYATSRAYAENFMTFDDKEWCLVLECRLEKGTYEQSKHTLNFYNLRENESELVENRSPDSSTVQVVAVWQFKKEFIDKQKDFNVMSQFLENYIQ